MADNYRYILASENLISELNFTQNDGNVHSGQSFLASQQVALAPWNYVLKRNFVQQHNLKFCENVVFEDLDFVLHSIALANRVVYAPFAIINYTIRANQTIDIQSSINKISNYIASVQRIYQLAKTFNDSRCDSLMGYAVFYYGVIIKRYLWRLKYADIIRLLNEYNPHIEFNSRIVNFAFNHPKTYAFTAVICAPFIKAAIKAFKLISKLHR